MGEGVRRGQREEREDILLVKWMEGGERRERARTRIRVVRKGNVWVGSGKDVVV